MKRVYIDTSAYLKEFSPETGSETTSKLFSTCESGKAVLVSSQWTLSVSIAAIDKKHRRGELSLEERDLVITTLLNKTMELAEKGNLVIVPIKPQLVQASWRIILERHISADDYLIERTKEEGFESYDVEDEADCIRLEEVLNL